MTLISYFLDAGSNKFNTTAIVMTKCRTLPRDALCKQKHKSYLCKIQYPVKIIKYEIKLVFQVAGMRATVTLFHSVKRNIVSSSEPVISL